MESLDNEAIFSCLRISPCSLEELAYNFGVRIRQVTPLVKQLLKAGAICRLDSKREGGPFYCLPGYVEDSGSRDNSDLLDGRDFSKQYLGQGWRESL